MKDAPKTIYLQVCDMDDCDDRFDMHEGVTWCQDKINDSDIEYIRADIPQQRTWVGLTDDEIDQGLLRSDYALQTAHAWRAGVVFAMTQLKEKNNA